MEKLVGHWQKYKSVWITIISVFVATRLILSVIGVISHEYLAMESSQGWKEETLEKQHPLLHQWAVWDSEWYLKMAHSGYSDARPFDPHTYSTVGFFPLYPGLIFLTSSILGDDLVAGILVSNFFLLLSTFLLYLLVKEDADETTARRSIWYLFLFPSAYILSAVYPESLLLCLWVGCMLAAKRQKWLWAGVIGLLAAMTKSVGFLVLVPALVIYIQKKDEDWRQIRPDILFLLLIPLGLLAVSGLHYLATGDMFAYSHVQQGAWGHYLVNPFRFIFVTLGGSFSSAFNAGTILIFITLLLGGFKKISPAYWIFALALIFFIPLNAYVDGIWRYAASLFPLIILLAVWGKSENADRVLVASMALLQGCFFVFWSLGYWFLV